MRAPKPKGTEAEYDQALREHLEQYCHLQNDGSYACKKCGAEILCVTCYCSIHIEPFDCAGFGEVVKKPLPFCPNCEKRPTWPENSTCFHV